MENAADALVMAGSMLIFIVALTICLSSFNTAKQGLDSLIEETETVSLEKDTSSGQYINYIESKKSNSTRVVGAETVVTSMYRAVKEDYVIYIKLDNYNDAKISTIINDGTLTITEATTSSYKINEGEKIIKVTIGSNQKVNTILSNGFYELIEGMSFNEYLGEYQEEVAANSANTETYRIITYIKI